jgi:hypothetical protein
MTSKTQPRNYGSATNPLHDSMMFQLDQVSDYISI